MSVWPNRSLSQSRLFAWFVAISGGVNIAGEASWHRLTSLLSGDYYATFAALSCAFILGSALGALFGAGKPRSVWICEVVPALWAIGWSIAIRLGVFNVSYSTIFSMITIFIPGFALGVHAPAYAAARPGSRFASTSVLYHLGGFIGLATLFFVVGNHLSLSNQLLAIGATQLIFGLIVWKNRQAIPAGLSQAPSRANRLSTAFRLSSWELATFAVGTLGFWWIMCALSEAVFLSYPLRIVQASVLITTIGWISVGSSMSRLFGKMPWLSIACFGGLGFLAIALTSWVSRFFLPQASIGGFIGAMLVIAGILTSPTLFSAAWYGAAADKLANAGHSKAMAGGRIWCLAAIGNILGCLIALRWGEDAGAFLLTFALIAGLACEHKLPRRPALVALSLVVLLFAHLALGYTGAWRNLENRHAGVGSHWRPTNSTVLERQGIWWDATDYRKETEGMHASAIFVIDGHQSTDYYDGYELAGGLVPATFFPHLDANRALVIGIGTGQTAWSVTHTMKSGADIVDISPAAEMAAHRLKAFNGDILNDPKAKLIRDDGMRVLDHCQPGQYDVIVNTATAPSLMNSSKLWTEEFTSAAKKCLSKKGIYVTYFIQTFARNKTDIDFLLRPIGHHFKHIDVVTNPYTMVVAYDQDRETITPNLNAGLLDSKDAQRYLLSLAPNMFAEADGTPKIKNTVPRIHDWPLDLAGPYPDMNHGDLEQRSVQYYIDTLTNGWHINLQRDVEAAVKGDWGPLQDPKP